MKSLSIKLTTGLIAGATLVAAASPAEAQYRRWHRDRGGDRAALAIGAGIVGLAAGAALASSSRWDRGWDRRGYRGWDRGYRGWDRRWDGGYGWRGRYDPRWGRPAWGYGYGAGYVPPPGYGYRWGGGVRCWRERVWDDWSGRFRRIRVCA